MASNENGTKPMQNSTEALRESVKPETTEADGNVNVKLEKHGSKDELGVPAKRDANIKSKSVLKQGHLRVKEDGQKVYKKTPSQIIMSATQLGIGCSVGRLSAKPERDVLMVDFSFVEKVFFPSSGSKETPSHRFNDFRFKSYAPVAFRYFRDIFKIQPSDFLISLANEPIREIGNPGASGSLFFVSNDDMFIVKTVQHKEATFLQQLLPGYYMNLHQNPRTLLPKFFGLYCYQSGTSNIRLTVMNNLLPSKYKCHLKFDLKGSTYKRKASKTESAKKSPTFKDLDYLNMFPDGILLDADTYDAVVKTIIRDLRVLESFSIMDYSFLLGIHNIDESNREKKQDLTSPSTDTTEHNPEREARRNEFVAALEAIQLITDEEDDFRPLGGIPARNTKGERLILFMGIIDILQSYRLAKKMEHRWKSLVTDGDTVSVHNPSFYAKRFLDFIREKVFRKNAVQRGASKRRSMKINPGAIHTPAKDISVGGTSNKTDAGEKHKTKFVTIIEPEKDPIDNKTEGDEQGLSIAPETELKLIETEENKMKELESLSIIVPNSESEIESVNPTVTSTVSINDANQTEQIDIIKRENSESVTMDTSAIIVTLPQKEQEFVIAQPDSSIESRKWEVEILANTSEKITTGQIEPGSPTAEDSYL